MEKKRYRQLIRYMVVIAFLGIIFYGENKMVIFAQAKTISSCVITITDTVYTGDVVMPEIEIVDGDTLLKEGKDYSLSAKNNIAIGKASITIKGISKYSGSVTKNFKILPMDVENVKVSPRSNGTELTLKWDKVYGATGYFIYQYNEATKKYTKLVTIPATSYTVKKLTPGTYYTFGIKAYKKTSSGNILSEHYEIASRATLVPNVTNFISTDSNYNAVYLSWTKMSKAEGYEIYLYDAATKKYTKVKTIKWNADACAIKDLKGNTSYTFAIRAYHTSNNMIYYSSSYVMAAAKTKKDYSQKTMYVDGDSIAYGTGAGGYSFADALSRKYGFQLTKKAQPGALLSTAYKGKGHIWDSVLENFDQAYDYVLLDGGVNDYLRSMKLGTEGTFNMSTTIGGLEKTLQYIRSKAPNAKIYFILPHKIYDSKTYHNTAVTKNKQGLTYADYRRAMIAMIRSTGNKYNVKIIDCYKLIDASNASQRKKNTADNDGIHPTKNAQINIYTPFIAKKMGL